MVFEIYFFENHKKIIVRKQISKTRRKDFVRTIKRLSKTMNCQKTNINYPKKQFLPKGHKLSAKVSENYSGQKFMFLAVQFENLNSLGSPQTNNAKMSNCRNYQRLLNNFHNVINSLVVNYHGCHYAYKITFFRKDLLSIIVFSVFLPYLFP